MSDNFWLIDDSGQLVSPYQILNKKNKIEAAQQFSVNIVTTLISEDLDGMFRGNNDIMILTRSSMGEQPFVERIHFFQEEIPKDKPIRNIYADTVFVTEDYSGQDRLWIELNVLEIDTDSGERKSAINQFESLAATAGAVFPAFLPYTFAAKAIVNLTNSIVSKLEKNEWVINMPVAFYSGEPTLGRAPLQTGTFVLFSKPVNPENFKLQQNGQIVRKDGRKFPKSYLVFEVRAKKSVSPEFVMNQKIATLLTQIRSGNPNTTKSAIHFLGQTLTSYTNFNKLKRYLTLIEKPSLSDHEKSLLKEIEKIEEIKPFLPRK